MYSFFLFIKPHIQYGFWKSARPRGRVSSRTKFCFKFPRETPRPENFHHRGYRSTTESVFPAERRGKSRGVAVVKQRGSRWKKIRLTAFVQYIKTLLLKCIITWISKVSFCNKKMQIIFVVCNYCCSFGNVQKLFNIMEYRCRRNN